MKTKVQRREFLQLAKTFSGKEKIAGWYCSEKLDGARAIWLGGLDRGLRTEHIPYANITDPKTGKRKEKFAEYATGLWSRYGNVINAPDWFLDQLPAYPLDGELFAGRGKFQTTMSIVKRDEPDSRWEQIQYAVYGCPPINRVFQDGEIKNTNFHKVIDQREVAQFIAACVETRRNDFQTLGDNATFEDELLAIQGLEGVAYCHKQVKLPDDEEAARQELERQLSGVLELGGEGLIIRNPAAVYTPKRVKDLLKFKPFQDDEAILVGFTSGRETDKGSKHLGKIGALILDYHGKRLELAGLTDEEREFSTENERIHAIVNPGKDMPVDFEGRHFKVGDVITFIYRELTDDGIPKEARYYRHRDEE